MKKEYPINYIFNRPYRRVQWIVRESDFEDPCRHCALFRLKACEKFECRAENMKDNKNVIVEGF